MTRPPDDPRDPRNQPPETRRFDPSEDTAAYQEPGYGQTGPTEPVPGYGAPGDPYAQQGPPDAAYSQAYGTEPPYGEPPYGDPAYGDPPPPEGGNTGRTVGLALAVIAALVVIILVGFLIVRDDGGETGAPAASSSSAAPTTTTTEPTTTTTTTEETTTTTTADVPPGEVVYQLTGNGDVVGLRYESRGQAVLVAATGAPWSQTARVNGTSAELTAIVIRGPVTCTIMQGEKQLTSSTSNGGPLRCAATVQR